MAADLNIIDSVIRTGAFTVFSRLVEGSLLEARLRAESSLTLFAPADMAFTRLPGDTLKWLLQVQNEQRLNQILLYHVVRGLFDCESLKRLDSARTEQGQDLKIDHRQTLLIDSARIVLKDIVATNGVIHGIDSLLMPCAASAAVRS